jgi:hypothetical protein
MAMLVHSTVTVTSVGLYRCKHLTYSAAMSVVPVILAVRHSRSSLAGYYEQCICRE